ncbi:type II toxin-antitoxin system RelE/ParE family toxin [Ferruginibacter paludis]|uniref:type II toxin-antitoxin system RelE/ParE family toxin n=1 Tax=Ferruginibacter paludis TaxID=1310417 RepID=UPI0025B59BEF|nr:type II toxin-antitoxin system RelE/ParE family toxin [Ferruginibacter paludis]MDN3654518.1 type II toxin-antitoxin system RelE/ParE family toxin [Ferruginibacter paludis]
MASYILSNKAVQDLSAIWEYTVDTWSERQADKYYFMLLESCQELADGTVRGKNYPEIDIEIFGFIAGQHVLFYRKLSAAKIEIVRILHGRMDLKHRIQQ